MAPTVGRIVNYWPGTDTEAGSNSNAAGPVPAIITRVWSEVCVNLTIFPDFSLPICRTSVLLAELPQQSARWSWPERV
jgi:hypothetical protein